nr:peptidase [Streptomyces sp. HSG2]
MPNQQRTVALVSAATLACSVVWLSAPTALAEVVDVDYRCDTPIGERRAVSPIDISAEREGDGYRITMSWQRGVSSSPVELGTGAMSPSATVRVEGADRQTVELTGPVNSAPVPPDTPIRVDDLGGTYRPSGSGEVTLTAGTLTIRALGTTTTCVPAGDPAPALTLDVVAADGGRDPAPEAPAEAAPAGPGLGDELPRTGPGDAVSIVGALGGVALLTGLAGAVWLRVRGRVGPPGG